MKAHIYNVETKEVVVTINGESSGAIEAKAEELNYLGLDEYGLFYGEATVDGACESLIITQETEEIEA